MNGKAADKASVLELIHRLATAVRKKDFSGAAEMYAPDARLFDVISPLQFIGAEEIRKRAEDWVAGFEGLIGYEIRDLNVAAGDRASFGHYLCRISGTLKDGRGVDMWVRATFCFRKLEGKWMVTHEHISVPFDPKSGLAFLDLRP